MSYLSARSFWPSLLILTFLLYTSCNQKSPNVKERPSFNAVRGINFTEVRRAFNSGLSINDEGYQLEPCWRLRILSDDSVRLYVPDVKFYKNYKIYLDHDSVLNMANTWLRLKKANKDSIIFQVLAVEGKEISKSRSIVYMTFYADDYVKNVLRKDPESLKRPTSNDTLFVKRKVKQATSNIDSSFAAKRPVILKSKSPILHVKKVKILVDLLKDDRRSDEYLYPEYDITINKAYKDFYYSFSVFVDQNGKMHFRRSEVYISPEFEESSIRVMKGVMEVYLQNLLEISPGKTLDMPHGSLIFLNVKGKKG